MPPDRAPSEPPSPTTDLGARPPGRPDPTRGFEGETVDADTDDFPLEDVETAVRRRSAVPSAFDDGDINVKTGPYDLVASVALGQRDSSFGYLAPSAMASAGAVLGAALGDALGHPALDLSSREAIREAFPPGGVASLELFWERNGERYAPYTSETQQAEIVLRTFVATRGRALDLDHTMELIGQGLVDWASRTSSERHPSNTCLAACAALERGVHWSRAGESDAAGSSGLARAYPIGLVFRSEPDRAEQWARAQSRLTHGAPSAIAASAAVAVGVARAARGDSMDLILSEMVAAACRVDPAAAATYADVYARSLGSTATEHVIDRLNGWNATDCLASAIFLWSRYRDDPRAALLEAANSPGKSTTIGALVGALTGARAGVSGLDPTWLMQVERSEALMALARQL